MKKTIYARTLNPEYYDYCCYEDCIPDDIYIDDKRDKELNSIHKIIDDYSDYYIDACCNGSFKEFIEYMFAIHSLCKDNGTKVSPKELHDLRQSLDNDRYESVVIQFLNVLHGTAYERYIIRGYSQSDYCTLYAPTYYSAADIGYIEAIYYGTGTEIEVSENENFDDVYVFYTTLWRVKDIKEEVLKQVGYNVDNAQVKLWLYERTYTIRKDEYILTGMDS